MEKQNEVFIRKNMIFHLLYKILRLRERDGIVYDHYDPQKRFLVFSIIIYALLRLETSNIQKDTQLTHTYTFYIMYNYFFYHVNETLATRKTKKETKKTTNYTQ